MNLFYEREKGTTKLGNRYVILRDDIQSFHVTVQGPQLVLYEHFTDVHSKEQMMEFIEKLESELQPKLLPEETDATE